MTGLKQLMKGAALAAALVPATALAGGGWIDVGASGWNGAGADVPGSPGANPEDLERCAGILRGPETGEDQVVQDMGWALYGAPMGDFGIRIVSAMLGATEDCRPLGFQDFIFVDGAYAGTISPELMDSGVDGARAEIGVAPGDLVVARFERWDGSSTWVNYYVDRGMGPVLIAIPNTPPPAAELPPLPVAEISAPAPGPSAAPSSLTAPVPDTPPVVTLNGTDDRVQPNNRFKIEVVANSVVGISRVSWFMTGTDDADLKAIHERTCETTEQECKETWRVRTLDSGVMTLKATAVDTHGRVAPEVTKEIRVRTSDGRPTVVMSLGEDVEAGQRTNLELVAKDEDGIDTMSWTATGTTDPELTANHEEKCLGDERCSSMWRLRPGASGTLTITARAKDKSGKESDLVTEELLVRGVNAKPTVEVLLNDEEFDPGETVRIELVGRDDEGIARMWWYASDTDDVALETDHEEDCGNDKACERTWRVTPNDFGRIKIHAKAIDNRKAESEEIVKIIRIKQR